MKKARILLADDHPAMRDKVADLLGDAFQIVASVADGKAAMKAATLLSPDVVLMDISMPIMNGIEAAERLVQSRTQAKILFLTVHDYPDFLKAALATGAAGYILKSQMATDLIPAIRKALAGNRFISRSFSK